MLIPWLYESLGVLSGADCMWHLGSVPLYMKKRTDHGRCNYSQLRTCFPTVSPPLDLWHSSVTSLANDMSSSMTVAEGENVLAQLGFPTGTSAVTMHGGLRREPAAPSTWALGEKDRWDRTQPNRKGGASILFTSSRSTCSFSWHPS